MTVLRDKSVQIWFDEPLLFAKLQDYVMNTPIVCVAVGGRSARVAAGARRALRASSPRSQQLTSRVPPPSLPPPRTCRYDLTRKCETGIPPWCVFLPSWGFPYNPKVRLFLFKRIVCSLTHSISRLTL